MSGTALARVQDFPSYYQEKLVWLYYDMCNSHWLVTMFCATTRHEPFKHFNPDTVPHSQPVKPDHQ